MSKHILRTFAALLIVTLALLASCDTEDNDWGVGGTPDLEVSKSVDFGLKSTASERDTISFVISVRNNSSETSAFDVAIRDTMPEGVTYADSSSASKGTYNPSTGLWSIDSVDAGERFTLTLWVVVDDNTAGNTITNTAAVTAVTPAEAKTDNNAGSASFVVVSNPPVAVDDAYPLSGTLLEGGTLTIGTGDGVLANDSDPEGESITVTNVPVSTVNGNLNMNSDGSFVYQHDGSETTSDSFTYEITDASGGTATAQVSITITPVNDDPIAQNDNYSVSEGGTLNVLPGTGVLSNDSDPEGDPLTVNTTPVTDVQNGTLTLRANGSFTYVHDGGQTTSDSFEYEVSDGNGGIATATVFIDIGGVNDDPIAVDDGPYAVDEGGSVDVPAVTGVLANDTDPDGDPLTVDTTPVSNVQNGTLTLNADGSFSYTHDGSQTTTDSFVYRVTDGNGGSATATASFDVGGVNDNPVAVDDGPYALDEGGTLTVLAGIGVLQNDTDPDGDVLTVNTTPVTDVQHGNLTLNADGSFVYAHDGSETTTDGFTYRVLDGKGGSDTANVTFQIAERNDNPVAQDDGPYDVDEGGTINIDAVAGVLANDSDPEGDALTVNTTPLVNVQHGTLTLNEDGSFSYTHDGGQSTTDGFSYTVMDARGGSASASVTLNILGLNDNPIAVDDGPYALNEGATLNVTQATGVLQNDSDPDLDPLSVNTSPVVNVLHGSLTLNANGSFSYTHDGTETTSDSFTYEVTDGRGGSATAVVSLEIAEQNDNPIAVNDSYPVDEGATININPANGVLDNDTDPEGDPLSVETTPVVDVQHGTLSLNSNGSFSYTHDGSETTSDSFTYRVNDDRGGTATAVVTLVVNEINDNPIAVNDGPYPLNEGQTLNVDNINGVLANDTDPENDPMTVNTTPVAGPFEGNLTLNADGSFSYEHLGGVAATDSFTYEVSDDRGGSATAVARLAINHNPVAVDDVSYSVAEAGTLMVAASGILTNDTDPDGDPLTVNPTPVTDVQSGTLTLMGDGSFQYINLDTLVASDSFEYEVSDGRGGVDTAMVTITINQVNASPVALDAQEERRGDDEPVDASVEGSAPSAETNRTPFFGGQPLPRHESADRKPGFERGQGGTTLVAGRWRDR